MKQRGEQINKWMLGRVIAEFRAPKNLNGNLVYKVFKQDSAVTVKNHNQAALGNINFVPAFMTKDGYVIPRNNIMIIGVEGQNSHSNMAELQEARVIKDSDLISEDNKKKLKELNTISQITSIEKQRSKYMTNGAIIGGIIGLAYAMYKGENKFMFAMLGVVGGGFVGNQIQNYTKK